MAHVVVDAHREVVLRLGLGQLVEYGLGHRWIELLGRQAVPAPDDPGHGGEPPGGHLFGQGRHDVLVQRLAGGTGLLGPVEHRQGLQCAWERRREGLSGEGPEQPDLQDPDLLAGGRQALDRLLHGSDSRAHLNDHALGLRMPGVVEQVIAAAR